MNREILAYRWSAVGSIARLDGWRAIIKRLSNPRLFNCVTPSMPANRKLGKLKQRRVGPNDLSERDDLCLLGSAVGNARELPAVIVSIVGDVENRLVAGEHLGRDYDRTIARLIKRPSGAHHLTRTRSATPAESERGAQVKGSSYHESGSYDGQALAASPG